MEVSLPFGLFHHSRFLQKIVENDASHGGSLNVIMKNSIYNA
jgi:hypothetical protein